MQEHLPKSASAPALYFVLKSVVFCPIYTCINAFMFLNAMPRKSVTEKRIADFEH